MQLYIESTKSQSSINTDLKEIPWIGSCLNADKLGQLTVRTKTLFLYYTTRHKWHGNKLIRKRDKIR